MLRLSTLGWGGGFKSRGNPNPNYYPNPSFEDVVKDWNKESDRVATIASQSGTSCRSFQDQDQDQDQDQYPSGKTGRSNSTLATRLHFTFNPNP